MPNLCAPIAFGIIGLIAVTRAKQTIWQALGLLLCVGSGIGIMVNLYLMAR